MVSSARALLILSLVAVLIPLPRIGVEGHWEDASHQDRNHGEIETHGHDHLEHHYHGRTLAVCEKESGNCDHDHGEAEEEETEAEDHHDHSHHDHDHHGESLAHSHSHSHSHSECHHDHGDESQADSHSHSLGHHDHGEKTHGHSHNGHAHHTCPYGNHGHHHHDEEHLFEKLGHSHGHGEEEHHLGHHHDHDHDHDNDLAEKKNLTAGLWLRAMGCSLLVSLASLVCLLFLPLIVRGGKPSRSVVDALAGFGAGCMLGDALLHQLPHAFSGHGGGGDHSHDRHHSHEHGGGGGGGGGEHGHGHSLEDLSVGLAVLAGILLFFLVEKIVRRTEELSVKGHSFGHGHHHHHHRGKKDDDKISKDDISVEEIEKNSDSKSGLRKRNSKVVEESENVDPSSIVKSETDLVGGKEARDGSEEQHASNFVLSYLNLFSDGVHNFTDGMALGSAFLLHGTVGGWSRTLFLLAHELPQEVGDFGILLRSGFGVFEALAFNFLSALMALAGTALALLVGGNPGHSSLIEGFTAGGFIYISVGAVMPDMHSQGNNLRTTVSQLTALSLGMGAAILISLAE